MEREGFVERAEKLKGSLPAELRQLFTRLSKGRRGVVMAAIVDNNCTVCRMRIRLQVVSDLRPGNRIIQCENCTRILYLASSEQT